ncbi:MAG: PAS domain S-box-containing protein [Candidatus Omnitrophota bacterium]|jgi:PAS domain S-box-containing protein
MKHIKLAIVCIVLALGATSSVMAADDSKALVFATYGQFPPYHALNSQGKNVGFDVDLAHALGKKLGREVIILQVPERKIIDFVLEGKVDAIVGITRSKEGTKIFNFSEPYLHHKTRLFVQANTNFVKNFTDLRGLRVGIRKGIDINAYLKVVPGINPVLEPDTETGLQDLSNRLIAVFMGDEYECEYVIQKNNMRDILTLGGSFLLRKRVIAVAKDNEQLLENINTALQELRADMSLQIIHDQWLIRNIRWSGSGRKSLILLLAVLGIVGIILLVSLTFNQKLSEAVADRTKEVESEHSHFENIFEHASDGIVVLNPLTFKVMQSNRAFEDILQYSQQELEEIPLTDLELNDTNLLKTKIQEAMRGGDNVLFETRLASKSREPIDFIIHARAMPYKDRTMVEAIARDITQQKKLEVMKDTILQDVAHELKTPMAKLSMSLELLEKKVPNSDKVDRHFDTCRRSMVRLQNTIEGILNLSRLESHAAEVHMEEIGLQDVLTSIIQELQMFADRKNITLSVKFDTEETASIRGDLEMIRRLYINLIHNAIKYTTAGTVSLLLTRDEQFVKVAVKDSGIGLSREDLTKIFERFYQKSAANEGSGVGLTISQKIVSYHNGSLWAESDGVDCGSAMLTMFPLYDFNQIKA